MRLFRSKKGQIENYFGVVIALFILGLSVFVSMLITYNFATEFQSAGYCGDTSCIQAKEGFITSLAMYDNIILIVMVVLLIGVGLTSYRLPADAAFFIVSFIMAPFLGMISYFFNHIFAQITSQAAFDVVRVFFPKTIILLTNMHWIALAAFVIGSIALYGKKRQGLGVVQ